MGKETESKKYLKEYKAKVKSLLEELETAHSGKTFRDASYEDLIYRALKYFLESELDGIEEAMKVA